MAAAHTPTSPEFTAYLEAGFAIDRSTTAGRAATSRRPQQIVDILADPDFNVTAAHRSEGVRTVLAMPMLDGDELIGVTIVWRREVRAFAPRQIQFALKLSY